jgi:signal transduction histidine kinase
MREKQARERRKKFQELLDRSLSTITQGEVESTVEVALAELHEKIDSAVAAGDTAALLDAEEDARRALASARTHITVALPRGLAMSTASKRDWTVYQSELRRIEESLLTPANNKVTAAVDQAATSIGSHVDRRRRVVTAVEEAVAECQSGTRTAVRQMDAALADFQGRAGVLRGELVKNMSAVIATAQERIGTTDYAALSDEDLVAFRIDLEHSIRFAAGRIQSALESVTAQITEMNWETDESGEVVTSADMAASAEEELMALRERSEQDLEMAQLGMAVSVIDHEFQLTVRSIRAGLRHLKAWTDLNPKLGSVYTELRGNFEHLDGYLTLFTPLQRRLRRAKTDIHGSEISSFLQTLFGERLERDGVELETTSAFKKAKISSFASTFYPVFVNLVDNSIFWLADVKGLRVISLDEDNEDLLVSDTGPGIPTRDREAVFEAGFTRKPGGRGLGLSISKQALDAAGFDLTVDRDGLLGGATFRISAIDQGGN